MAPRRTQKRGGSSIGSSKFAQFRRTSTPKSTSSVRSHASATPAPSRRSVIPGVRTANARTRAPSEAVMNETSENHSTHPLQPEIDDDADALNEVVMAVDLRERGTVGCAYYSARNEKLYFMEDAHLGGADVIDAREVVFLMLRYID